MSFNKVKIRHHINSFKKINGLDYHMPTFWSFHKRQSLQYDTISFSYVSVPDSYSRL